MDKRPIAVMDSGVGGLTVITAIQKLLPNEDVVYFGDSGNCPYGNRTPDDIVNLTVNMCDFLYEKGAKIAVFACNTISTLQEKIAPRIKMPCIGIIEPISKKIGSEGISPVGIISTNQTFKSNVYPDLIKKYNENAAAVGVGSSELAELIDRGDFDYSKIDDVILNEIPIILKQADCKNIVLGCTHYPIVKDRFEKLFPNITFIDPGMEEAVATKELLTKNNTIETSQNKGTLTIYTSGKSDVYAKMCKLLNITYTGIFEV